MNCLSNRRRIFRSNIRSKFRFYLKKLQAIPKSQSEHKMSTKINKSNLLLTTLPIENLIITQPVSAYAINFKVETVIGTKIFKLLMFNRFFNYYQFKLAVKYRYRYIAEFHYRCKCFQSFLNRRSVDDTAIAQRVTNHVSYYY